MKRFIKRLLRRKKHVASPNPAPRKRLVLSDAGFRLPIYAIGDIHGRLDLLREAERRISTDLAAGEYGQALIIVLGDCIDRGPDSAGVIDYLLQSPPENLRRIVLCGNHEAAFLDFIRNPRANEWWLEFGGRQTLLSYGIDVDYFVHRGRKAQAELVQAIRDTVPHDHLQFLSQLPVSVCFRRYIFVHAGLRPGIPLEQQSDLDMMWIREPFLTEGPKLGPYVVIHGHTPVLEPEVGAGRICIDTGAVTTNNLTVLRLIENKAFLVA